MGDILAYDIDGKPLKKGDQVIIVGSRAPFNGKTTKVIGPSSLPAYDVDIDLVIPGTGLEFSADGDQLRKIDSDHKPAEQSFSELMSNLTGSLEVSV